MHLLLGFEQIVSKVLFAYLASQTLTLYTGTVMLPFQMEDFAIFLLLVAISHKLHTLLQFLGIQTNSH